jgi:Zn-dependent M28 family amino/carboxypeptidase
MRAIAAVAVAAAAFAQTRAPGNDTIRRDDLKADLYFLASDAMRGRLTATPEYNIAGKYVESRFQRLGLKPAGRGDSLLHSFSLTTTRLGGENRLEIAQGENLTMEAKLLEDFYPNSYSGSGRARGEMVFAGYGIVAPSLNWDDYRGAKVKGRIVVILTGEPGANDPKSPFDGLVTSEHSTVWRKILWAQERGAAGVLFAGAGPQRGGARPQAFANIARAAWPERPPRIPRYALTTWVDRVRIPVGHVSPAVARTILGREIAEAAKAAERAGGVTAEALGGAIADLRTDVHRTPVDDRNVVGLIEGSDATLKSEAVLISAHYDHDGADGDRIFNGADDDGSGTVALMEIAEAYAAAAAEGKRPRRSVIFAAWASEERGLLGAWAWTENPLWPLDRTVAVLNMDMIGRNEEVPENGGPRFNGLRVQTAASNANAVNIMGYSYSPDLASAVAQANKEIDLQLRLRYDNNRSQLLRRSDQWPFLQRGVPSLFFHTGLHPDYHTVNDRPERIEYPKMERITRLVHQTSWDLANQDARPRMLSPRPIPEPE